MALSKLPTKNIMVIVLFGGGIIFFVLLSIFPNYIAYSNINSEIDMLKSQIEEQKILSPIFTDLSDRANFQPPENLPFPEQRKLATNETSNISGVIQDIILLNDFKLETISADVGGLVDGSGLIKINVEISGDFMNLRNLILQLGTLPYLEHIENIRIDSGRNGQTIRLKLWIAQEV